MASSSPTPPQTIAPKLSVYTSSSQSSPQNAVTFTHFPELAKELRLKVWRFASFQTRNIGVWVREFTDIGDLQDDSDHPIQPFHFDTTVGIPAVLHISHESRTEGLKHYKLCLGTSLELKRPHLPIFFINFEPRTYINFKSDRICMMEPENWNWTIFKIFVKEIQDHCHALDVYSLAINTKYLCNDHFVTVLENLDNWLYIDELVFFEAGTMHPWTRQFHFEDLKPPYVLGNVERAEDTPIGLMRTFEQWTTYWEFARGRVFERARVPTDLNARGQKVRRCRLLCDGVPV